MGRYLLPPVTPRHRQMMMARKGGRGISISVAATDEVGVAAGKELHELWAVFGRGPQLKPLNYIAYIDDREIVIAPIGGNGMTRLIARSEANDILKEKNRIWPEPTTTA